VAPLLLIRDLSVRIRSDRGTAYAVRGVNLSIEEGRIVALVGESGSGKSATAKAVLRLHDERTTELAGSIEFSGAELLSLRERDMRALRGRSISMIFQDPMTSLNPVFRVGDQVAEAVRRASGLGRREAAERAISLLADVGIAGASRRARQYPHEFSGGMLQRALIAIAVAASPRLLVADEPTTALDVTVQAQILALLDKLVVERGMSLLLITHDLGIVAERAATVAVMYAGRIVETGPSAAVLEHPLHPYTEGLIAAVPRAGTRGRELATIAGSPPGIYDSMPGCPFAPRCPYRVEECEVSVPPLISASAPEEERSTACIRAGELTLRGIA
jgi:oligopeptide/dipeptide ABC transporter ATP-binding protein